MKKRIGFVVNAPLKYSETFLLSDFRLLEEMGYEIFIFEGYSQTQNKYPYKRIKALPLERMNIAKWLFVLKIFTRLLIKGLVPLIRFLFNECHDGTSIGRSLKRVWFSAHILPYKVDHLHFCFADVAIQKESVANAIGAMMSVSLRGSDIIMFPRKNPDCYRRLWKHVDRVHAVSNWIYSEALNTGLDKAKSPYIIHDGVDTDVIPFNESDLHNPLRILSVGRLEPVKDHFLALEVIRQLIDDNLRVHYTIIGEGTMKELLLSRIKELGIEQHVLLYGRENHDDLLVHMSKFDMLLHTSVSEGLGVALLEAQAAGLLVVSLDSGGTEESIEDGKSGWIIRSRVPDEVVEKIKDISQLEADKRLDHKKYARQRIENAFNSRKNAAHWNSFFRKADSTIA